MFLLIYVTVNIKTIIL